jgi:hypothetical protein
MLGYYLGLHLLVSLFGDAAWLVRLPSAVATAATAALVAALGTSLFERRVGLTAGVIVAVSLPLVYWGQQARGYAAMVAFATASFAAFASVLSSAQRGGRAPRTALAAYVASALLAVYMGLIAVLVVAAQLLVVAAVRRGARPLLASIAVVAGGCVPLLVLAVRRGSGQLFWVPRVSLSVLGQAARTLTSAGLPPNFHATDTATAALVALGALLLGAVAALGLALRAPPLHASRWPELLVASWLLVPVALALLGAAAGEPVELARSSVLVMPALALALAWALHHPRIPTAVAWGSVAGVVALRALQLAPSYGVSPEPWRSATHYVLAAARAGGRACVAFYPEDGRMVFDYYARRGPASARAGLTPVLPSAPWSAVVPYVERYRAVGAAALARIARGCPTLWLISSHAGQPHGPPRSRVYYRRYQALAAGLAHLYLRQHPRSLGWAAAIRVVRFSR